jgi:uncharacterized protein
MNQLSKETSPYLLQHAHNPVHWYAWKPEAFEKARREDKPILVSIGYSTCHWCHVMERESFENQSVADFMNEHFVCIKVDREERPDVDQIYMEACQVISGSGGWPLNCFLTPDMRPFFAGTYYPPMPAYQRPSWQQILQNMAGAFQQKRDIVEEQADKLTEIIRGADKTFVKKTNFESKIGENAVSRRRIGMPKESYTEGSLFSEIFNKNLLDKIFDNLSDRFDRQEGGFGGAPKFPGTMSIQFLLDYYFYTKNDTALHHAELSLTKMIQGGIYDQIGGGFARYATDREWLIPHFEKMLYDNALLIQVISDAYKLTKKDIYRETIEETLDFTLREMQNTDLSRGYQEESFYSAYDADSEGVEGKFYVWQKAEIDAILGEESPLFCAFYDVSKEGNWEENTILWRPKSYETFAAGEKMDVMELKKRLKTAGQKLYSERSKRIKPSLDDKILLSWNALMISAFAKAYEALGMEKTDIRDIGAEKYRKTAINALNFIFNNMQNPEGGYFHTYKNGKAQYAAFLEDYAYLIEAILDVYQITFDAKYVYKAQELTDFVLENFFDDADNLFFFTSKNQTDILLRKKDLYDSAMPSGNSTMMKNLGRLAIIFDNHRYKNVHFAMLETMVDAIKMYPTSFSKWASGVISAVHPPFEIAVLGDDYFDKTLQINALFLPNKILMASADKDEKLPLLDRDTEGSIFLCQNYACQLPVKTVDELIALMG